MAIAAVERFEKRRNFRRVVLPVAIQRHGGAEASRGGVRKASLERSTFTQVSRMSDDGRARGVSFRCGVVSGAIVNDKHRAGVHARGSDNPGD